MKSHFLREQCLLQSLNSRPGAIPNRPRTKKASTSFSRGTLRAGCTPDSQLFLLHSSEVPGNSHQGGHRLYLGSQHQEQPECGWVLWWRWDSAYPGQDCSCLVRTHGRAQARIWDNNWMCEMKHGGKETYKRLQGGDRRQLNWDPVCKICSW